MNTEKEMNKIESRINLAGFGKGLGEIFMAVSLWFIWALHYFMPEDTNFRFIVTLTGILLLGKVLNYLRKRYVFPRTGYLKKNNFSKQELLKVVYLIPAIFILSLPLILTKFDFGFTGLASFIKDHIFLIMGFDFTLFFVLSAKIMRINGLIYYGLILGGSIFLKHFFPISLEHLKVFYSFVLLVSGSIQFYRFIKNNPVLESEDIRNFETASK